MIKLPLTVHLCTLYHVHGNVLLLFSYDPEKRSNDLNVNGSESKPRAFHTSFTRHLMRDY